MLVEICHASPRVFLEHFLVHMCLADGLGGVDAVDVIEALDAALLLEAGGALGLHLVHQGVHLRGNLFQVEMDLVAVVDLAYAVFLADAFALDYLPVHCDEHLLPEGDAGARGAVMHLLGIDQQVGVILEEVAAVLVQEEQQVGGVGIAHEHPVHQALPVGGLVDAFRLVLVHRVELGLLVLADIGIVQLGDLGLLAEFGHYVVEDGFDIVAVVEHGVEVDVLLEEFGVFFLEMLYVPIYARMGVGAGLGHAVAVAVLIAVQADKDVEVVLRQEILVFVEQHPVRGHRELDLPAELLLFDIIYYRDDERHVHQRLSAVEADIGHRGLGRGDVGVPDVREIIDDCLAFLYGEETIFALVVAEVHVPVCTVFTSEIARVGHLENELLKIDESVQDVARNYPAIIENRTNHNTIPIVTNCL